MLPPAFGRHSCIYPLGGANAGKAREWLARAKLEPANLVLYATNDPRGVVVGALTFNLKQIGIVVATSAILSSAPGSRRRTGCQAPRGARRGSTSTPS